MSRGFTEGWLIAVDWIYNMSVAKGLNDGINPKGDDVTYKMSILPRDIRGIDAGFAEGLIYAIGKPLVELKSKLQ